MSKKSEPVSRTRILSRQNLIAAFERIFPEKPIEKISIKEITNAAGYNRSTFYLYFKDIYELADAFEAAVLEEVSEVVGNVIKQNANLPLTDLIGLMAPAASSHIGRIYLCSLLPGFPEKFRTVLQPLFETITGMDSSRPEHDFLLSLLSSILLHNISFLHEHGNSFSAAEATRISRCLIAPGLMDLITDYKKNRA